MGETSPFRHDDDADNSPGFQFWKVSLLWQRTLGEVFAKFGITQTQYAILASLRWFEEKREPPTQAHLVEHARIDKMTLSKAIRKLEEMGLLLREASATDSRAVDVRFTARGRKLVQQAVAAVEAADEAFFGCLGPEDRNAYQRVMRRLAAPRA